MLLFNHHEIPSCICYLHIDTLWSAQAHDIIKSVNFLAQSERNNYCNKCVLDYCLYTMYTHIDCIKYKMYRYTDPNFRNFAPLTHPPSKTDPKRKTFSHSVQWCRTTVCSQYTHTLCSKPKKEGEYRNWHLR